MTFRRFFYRSICLSAALVLTFVVFNLSMNEFGLFGDARGKKIRLWTAEKTSKYLLSFNYIPANFNAIMVGPSLSDNIDTRKIEGFRVYNMSVEGANVRVLKLPLLNVLERGKIDFMILCVHPYMTQDNVLKDKRLTPHIYWSTLGSSFTFKFYGDKLKKLMNPANDSFTESHSGYLRPIQKVVSVEAAINDYASKIMSEKNLASKGPSVKKIDPAAFADLKEIIDLAHKKGVRIIAYYHPDPLKVFTSFATSYRSYQQIMNTLFSESDLVYDFNTPEYDGFRNDPGNYIDHGHLSVKGADFLAGEFNRLLKSLPPNPAKIDRVPE